MNTEAYVYLPDELRRRIPSLYATEGQPDPTVWISPFWASK